MSNPLVSAVILTYNQAPFIAQTLDCALAQRVNFPYEILVADDASTDDTVGICRQYQNRYPALIQLLSSQRNQGLLANYFRTVSAARGTYIAPCGGDDFWHHPDKLALQVAVFENEPRCGLVHSDVNRFHQTSGLLVENYHRRAGHKHDYPSHEILRRIVSLEYNIAACSAMFRKTDFDALFDISEYTKSGFPCEDTPFWADIAATSAIKYLSESLATHRVVAGSLSNRVNAIQHLRFWKGVAHMRVLYCDKYGLPAPDREAAFAMWFDRALRLAYSERDSQAASALRRQKQALNLKEWLWYSGARNALIHFCLLPLVNYRWWRVQRRQSL